MEEIVVKKKLSHNIERTGLRDFNCNYLYKFSTNQWLENVDSYEYFGILHNETKQKIIDSLVEDFRISLNNVIFGDPAGKQHI